MTPAHAPVMVAEVLELLAPAPGERGVALALAHATRSAWLAIGLAVTTCLLTRA